MVGSDQVWSIERPYVRNLKELGCNVELFAAHDIFYKYYAASVVNKILYSLGARRIYNHINNQLKERINSWKPDVVWVFKGMEIFPATLRWISERNIKLINYNPDNPFLFSSKGSGNKNVTDSIPLYDLHFSYNLEVKDKLEREFNVKTLWLPFGFSIEEGAFESAGTQEEVQEVCFLGNPDRHRADFISGLADRGIPMNVYGHGWKKFLTHPSIKVFDAVLGEELWRVLRRYRVQLNLMRPHNENSHNMRSFEIPAIGGIMVAPDTLEHRIFFEDQKETMLFGSVDDCAQIIRRIIGFRLVQADSVRLAARERSLKSGYSYKDRATFVLKAVEDLLNV